MERARSLFKEPVWGVGEEEQGSSEEAANDQPLEGWVGPGNARVRWEVNWEPDHGTQSLPTTTYLRALHRVRAQYMSIFFPMEMVQEARLWDLSHEPHQWSSV